MHDRPSREQQDSLATVTEDLVVDANTASDNEPFLTRRRLLKHARRVCPSVQPINGRSRTEGAGVSSHAHVSH